MRKILVNLFFVLIFAAGSSVSAAVAQNTQESSEGEAGRDVSLYEKFSIDAVTRAFKSALSEDEAEKARKEKELAVKLRLDLSSELENWISRAREEKTPDLNKLLHNDWIELTKFTTPVPYDYYLRDFDYMVDASDVYKSQTVPPFYKASARIVERLFIERTHSTSASSIEPYLQTAVTPIALELEYRDDTFVVVNADRLQPSIEDGWQMKRR